MHGALHLFDAGDELQKYTWVNTGIKLIDQIKNALDKDYFPLFVSEGRSIEKKNKIMHSSYLSRGMRSFSQIGGALFIYGHSFSDNDTHILDLIPKSKITKLFVGLYGVKNSQDIKLIINKAKKVTLKKKSDKKIELYFYNSESANVWK